MTKPLIAKCLDSGLRRGAMAGIVVVVSAIALSAGIKFFATQTEFKITPETAVAVAASAPTPRKLETLAFEDILDQVSDTLSVARYAGNSRVLVFDFPNLTDQGLTFNRIAAFVEKQDTPRNRLLTGEELQRLVKSTGKTTGTLYFGHDYRASDLAKFFNRAAATATNLNAEERKLRQLLLEHKALLSRSGKFAAAEPEQVLISLTQTGPTRATDSIVQTIDRNLRSTVLRHELSHAVFFMNDDYRSYCFSFWENRLTPDERRGFLSYFAGEGYDINDQFLVVNEMQAYLMHTPEMKVFNETHIGTSKSVLNDMRARFRSGHSHPQLGISQ